LATLRDVAQLAGVSKATASLALNNKPVNEKTRIRVVECTKKLNYIPNRIGRSLITGKSSTIELLIMNAEQYTNIAKQTSLYYYIIQGILKVPDSKNYSLRFDLKYYEDKHLMSYIERKILDKSLEGIIILPQFARDYGFITLFEKYGFPYVMLCGPTYCSRVNSVDMGNYDGGDIVPNSSTSINLRR